MIIDRRDFRGPVLTGAALLLALCTFDLPVAAQTYVFGTASFPAPGINSYTSPPLGNTPMATADFNGDGIPDFAIAGGNSNGNGVWIFLGRSDGTFAPMVQYAVLATGLTVGDFNSDAGSSMARRATFPRRISPP